ncbi:MAG: SigE family RNA polymerase sigma factor [Solirubrobacteraceae bacterium]
MELGPSFDSFVAEDSARLLRCAYLLCGNRNVAEDLLQVTLVRTARRWDVASRSPHAYAYRVLVNLLHDRRRNLGRRVVERSLDELAERDRARRDESDGVIDRLAITAAVHRLPSRQRTVLVLRFFADLSVAETAEVIGASEGTVKTHTSRALLALRDSLADQWIQSTTAKDL